MESKLDLNQFIKDNYESIKNGTYDWDDDKEFVEVIYKFASKIVSNINISRLNKEDLMQELVTHTFSHALKNLDLEKYPNSSTYIYSSMVYYSYRILKRMNKVENTIKLDKEVYYKYGDNAILLMDSLKSDEPTPFESLLLEKNTTYYEILKDCINEDELLKYYYIDNLSLKEIAKVYTTTHQTISNNLKNRRKMLKIKMIEKGAFELRESINVNNLLKDDSEQSKYIYDTLKNKGLIYLAFNSKTKILDICNALNVEINIVSDSINERINNKVRILEEKGVKEAKVFTDFIAIAKPSLLYKVDEFSIEYIDSVIKKIKNDEDLYNYLMLNEKDIVGRRGKINKKNRLTEKGTKILKSIKN